MGDLDFNSILSGDEINDLFDNAKEDETVQASPPEENGQNEGKQETAEDNQDDIFDGPESVGGEDDNQVGEDTALEALKTPTNIYSSIAKAFKDDGIFPDLDEDTVNNVKSAEDFAKAVEAQLKSRFDEKQKRIDEALTFGVEPTIIKKYENTISYLENITEEAISEESENGDNFRKNIIYQDYINNGFTKERALREVQRSFKSGNDIEDAREALENNKEFFKAQYEKILQEAKDREKIALQERKKEAEAIKKSILDDKNVFGDIQIDNATRKKAYSVISDASYKDPDTGNYLTELQRYEKENKVDFLKNMGLIYVLTDGFKNVDKLVNSKVKKQMKKEFSNLENAIANTSRNSDGSLRFVTSSRSDDDQSYFGKNGWLPDV